MIDYQMQVIRESQPMDVTATRNVPVRPSFRLRKCSTLVAFGLALLVASPSAVRPATADEATDAVAQLLRGLGEPAAASLSATGAQAVRAEIVQQLGEIQVSVQKCDAFLERFGERPAVARALQRIETQPGRTVFTSPDTISETRAHRRKAHRSRPAGPGTLCATA